MYQSMLPVTGAGLAIGGIVVTLMNMVWLGIAVVVIGGMLITLSKFGPRVAIEPMAVGVHSSRFRLTVNGRPVSWPRSR
ncbi:hypothetical protein [Actinoplanes xinjiangensis]|uniref:Uncharacterized protein n=1 Tax=Actinoplanes xinjiangensis TaxID=512350 RepID=A0A316EQH8_9ACTN|nr:hypothetical protein [Actinoplanes xinjiangensis]PWK33253.1 hypothetical protein BC793_12843 [Actinoplanes xinjiangensis]GIF43508.1 hypothetical protein Axi01nite_78190 [Actinoplanes xinjiangensis]